MLAPRAFSKFVQIGRVVVVNYGPHLGKKAVIVNILNDNRVQIDGEEIPRQVIPIRRLTITKFLISGKDQVFVGQRTPVLRKKIQKFDLNKKFAESSLGKKQAAQQKRESLGDFDRFKVMVLKKRMNRLVRTEVNKLRKARK